MKGILMGKVLLVLLILYGGSFFGSAFYGGTVHAQVPSKRDAERKKDVGVSKDKEHKKAPVLDGAGCDSMGHESDSFSEELKESQSEAFSFLKRNIGWLVFGALGVVFVAVLIHSYCMRNPTTFTKRSSGRRKGEKGSTYSRPTSGDDGTPEGLNTETGRFEM